MAVRALRHRNFRVYFFGMFVSFTGTSIQVIAQSWLVYRLTGSPFLLGLAGFAGQIPVFALAPLGGVAADRHSRHRIVLLTQTVSMLQAFLLAWLTLSGSVTIEAVLALSLVLGVVNAFDFPARQSFLMDLAGGEDLMNAIALNSSVINSARILGPALAGFIVGLVGEGLCFFINGVSFLVVIGGLLTIKLSTTRTKPSGPPLVYLKEGFDFAYRNTRIRAVLVVVALVGLFGFSYTVLMPIFADVILKGGPKALGILLGAAGLGALGGALALATRGRVEGLTSIIAISMTVFGVVLILFSSSRNMIVSTALLIPAGFTLIIQTAGCQTLLQYMVPDMMRGRVMSFFSLCLIGVAPFGCLLSGAVAGRIGAPKTLAACGVIYLVGAVIFSLRMPSLNQKEDISATRQATLDTAEQALSKP